MAKTFSLFPDVVEELCEEVSKPPSVWVTRNLPYVELTRSSFQVVRQDEDVSLAFDLPVLDVGGSLREELVIGSGVR